MRNKAAGMAIGVVIAALMATTALAATFGVQQSGSSAIFYVDTTSWADLHYVRNNGGQLNYRMTVVNGRNEYTVTGLVAGDVIDYFFTYWDVSCNCARDTAWARYTHGGTPPPVDAGTPPPLGTIIPLYGSGTPLEQATVENTATALITRVGDRVRDRHAREDQYQAYDHYLARYFEKRTHTVEIVDEVAKGGSRIVVNLRTIYPYDSPDFRAFFRGLNTVAEYFHNADFTTVNDYLYTASVNFNAKEGRAIRVGDRMEIEIGVFLRQPVEGRFNYYSTAMLYIVGSGGIMPFDVTGSIRDSIPMPEAGQLGGRTTGNRHLSNEPRNHYLQMALNMAPVNAQPFMEGRRIHHTNFADGTHSEPNNPILTTLAGKLGPDYVSVSCISCHVQNGRGLPPAVSTTLTNYVVKVGNSTGGPDPFLGTRLQPRRTSGTPEADVRISGWTLTNGTFADGTPYQLRRPTYSFLNVTPTNYSARISPQLVGMGLLEAIPETAVAALADPNDSNGDGISGRMQTVRDPETGEVRLGRFGWKAGMAKVKHQVADALNRDIGVTTSIFQTLDCGPQQAGCAGASTELSAPDLDKLTRYIALLGVPARRDLQDATALRGETLFNSAGCAKCHATSFTTSSFHPNAELRGQAIRPYTDLLLHDMGPGLADNLGDGIATGAEWRTPPLWGIGLTAGVSGGEAYLHDGRARNLTEAILWHGGEGQAARNAFAGMSAADRAALLRFLQTL